MWQEVLDFWFDGDEKKWWVKSDEFDERIRDKFSDLIAAVAAGNHDDWWDNPDSCLAAIIVLDQFSRNAFRGTPASFANDLKARSFAKRGIANGFDLGFPPEKRFFFYMPLEHSEAPDDQEMSIAVFERLNVGIESEMTVNLVDYAYKHKAIIDRFGRYPHRNDILGRTCTDEETEFLTQPGSSF